MDTNSRIIVNLLVLTAFFQRVLVSWRILYWKWKKIEVIGHSEQNQLSFTQRVGPNPHVGLMHNCVFVTDQVKGWILVRSCTDHDYKPIIILWHSPAESHKQTMNTSSPENQIALGQGDTNHKEDTKHDYDLVQGNITVSVGVVIWFGVLCSACKIKTHPVFSYARTIFLPLGSSSWHFKGTLCHTWLCHILP